jgi:hypothetical protein
MQFDWSIAVQDHAILHKELKCLGRILKMSLCHCNYFIKQLPNGFPSRIACGCCLTFGKHKNTLACGSSIFTLSESLAASLVHGSYAILRRKPFGIPLIPLQKYSIEYYIEIFYWIFYGIF